MDRIQIDRSERRLKFYREWLDTCSTVSYAENCIGFAQCDPALSVFDYALLMALYLKFGNSMGVRECLIHLMASR